MASIRIVDSFFPRQVVESCPSGEDDSSGTKLYYVVQGTYSFTEAPGVCSAMGARLASYKTQEEMDVVAALLDVSSEYKQDLQYCIYST